MIAVVSAVQRKVAKRGKLAFCPVEAARPGPFFGLCYGYVLAFQVFRRCDAMPSWLPNHRQSEVPPVSMGSTLNLVGRARTSSAVYRPDRSPGPIPVPALIIRRRSLNGAE